MLVVEDHALMRSLVADAFGQRGFEVTASPSAVEALRVADEADPDLLVTDIDLGSRPNGVELATILRERAPHIAVLFLSNVSREAAAAQAKDTVAGASFVNKGAIASVDELVDAAEAVLADRPVAHLAEGLRAELHGTPIKVTVLYPGYIRSEMNEKVAQSTPLMASTEKGVRAMVDAIEKEKDSAHVPALPWAPMSVLMRHAPMPIFKKLI